MNSIKTYTLRFAVSDSAPFILGAMIIGLLLSYVVLANTAVRKVTLLEHSKSSLQSLRMKVSELESEQFITQNAVNKDAANKLGLVEVKNPTFIMKSGHGDALSMRR
jgi:hypothetical protein